MKTSKKHGFIYIVFAGIYMTYIVAALEGFESFMNNVFDPIRFLEYWLRGMGVFETFGYWWFELLGFFLIITTVLTILCLPAFAIDLILRLTNKEVK